MKRQAAKMMRMKLLMVQSMDLNGHTSYLKQTNI